MVTTWLMLMKAPVGKPSVSCSCGKQLLAFTKNHLLFYSNVFNLNFIVFLAFVRINLFRLYGAISVRSSYLILYLYIFK